MDREKVISGLEDIQKHLDTGYSFAISWKSELIRDALALLKEQEAVKPKSKSRHGSTTMYQHFCGNCMAMLHGKPKYCPNCGRSVKWE